MNQMKVLKQAIDKVDPQVYKKSVNIVQLYHGFKNMNWKGSESLRSPLEFLREYDMNNDGRLSPRELILGAIMNNKSILGNDICKLCFEEIIDQIDGVFTYMDCGAEGAISSEQLWNGLPKLRRMTKKTNFFDLADIATIRTAVTNDFILKNMNAVQGKVNKNEFRLGILLGYWDRQTDDFGIIKDDSKNMKKIRWSEDDTIDNVALKYVRQATETKANQ
jgi:hypothetical protein